MTGQMIQALIREVLAEELAKLRGGKGLAPSGGRREERVVIANDADLAAFVQKVLALSEDPGERQKLQDGRITFRLAAAAPGPAIPAAPGGQRHVIERGLLSERQVDLLPGHTTSILIGKDVRTTPLARDRLRQRGIVIERMK